MYFGCSSFGCLCQYNQLSGKTCLWNDLLRVKWIIKLRSLSCSWYCNHRLGWHPRSSGSRACCYAELAISSLLLVLTITITHCAYHGGMARLSWPGWPFKYWDCIPNLPLHRRDFELILLEFRQLLKTHLSRVRHKCTFYLLTYLLTHGKSPMPILSLLDTE